MKILQILTMVGLLSFGCVMIDAMDQQKPRSFHSQEPAVTLNIYDDYEDPQNSFSEMMLQDSENIRGLDAKSLITRACLSKQLRVIWNNVKDKNMLKLDNVVFSDFTVEAKIQPGLHGHFLDGELNIQAKKGMGTDAMHKNIEKIYSKFRFPMSIHFDPNNE